ncbi:MAG: outer membrane protein transport protein [Myxococcales bacterium]|nr:outer membrane protein transport protein [Myxococcales bacterium]
MLEPDARVIFGKNVRIHSRSANYVAIYLLIGCCFSPIAGATGFPRGTPSARHMARAGAVTATVDDPSAIYYNPAGLASTKGTEVLVGLTTRIPDTKYSPGSSADLSGFGAQAISNSPELLPHIFLSRSLSEKAFVGFGFYQPYSHRYQWEASSPEPDRRYEFVAYSFAPTVALKLNHNISVALGISIIPATLNITQPLAEIGAPATDLPSEGIMTLESSAFGVAATFGLQLEVLRHIKLGASFHSGVELSFTGDVDFEFERELTLDELSLVPNQVITDVSVPHVLSTGIAWEQGAFTIEVSGNILFWDTFNDTNLEFTPSTTLEITRNWHTTFTVQSGLEYRFQKIAGRLGAAWAASPVPSATLDWTTAAADELRLALGLGYDFSLLRTDVGYVGAIGATRAVPTNRALLEPKGGSFDDSWTHRFTLSIGIRL